MRIINRGAAVGRSDLKLERRERWIGRGMVYEAKEDTGRKDRAVKFETEVEYL